MEIRKKVVSFSLWGTSAKYTVGAVRNAELVRQMYPGWTARFYCGASVPHDIIQQLKNCESEVILMQSPGDWTGMFWRFNAAGDEDVDAMISRDCDSRISQREVDAVNAWINSDYLFHIMRDHPWHGTPILGGMWGVKAPLLRNMKQLTEQFEKGNYWQIDQNFLKLLYPHVEKYAMIHDEFFSKRPWPTKREKLEFVGQVFDENENTVQEHLDILAHHIGSK